MVLATLEPPPKKLGVTRWSHRLPTAELGISNAKVADVWRECGLQPWRRETFKFSADPELEAKLRDVAGLCFNPPGKAMVLCADKKVRRGLRQPLAGWRFVAGAEPLEEPGQVGSGELPVERPGGLVVPADEGGQRGGKLGGAGEVVK